MPRLGRGELPHRHLALVAGAGPPGPLHEADAGLLHHLAHRLGLHDAVRHGAVALQHLAAQRRRLRLPGLRVAPGAVHAAFGCSLLNYLI